MFTTCPECGTVFRIGPAQLRAAEGFVRCGTCAATFNALLSLTDEPPATAGGAAVLSGESSRPPLLPPAASPPPPIAAVPPASAVSGAPAAAVTTLPPREDRFPPDPAELAIPDEFGPEYWDDTLDLPEPAAVLDAGFDRLPDDDTGSDGGTPSGSAGHPDALRPAGREGEDDQDAPVGGVDAADDLLLPGLDDGEDGDTLAGVVEHADWESLLTGLDDEEEESAEPVYIVEEEAVPPAPPPAARATPPPAATPSVAPPAATPAAKVGLPPAIHTAGPTFTATPAPAAAEDFANLPPLDEDPLSTDDEAADDVPPLGILDDDDQHDDLADEPLPPLGGPATGDVPLTGGTAPIPLTAAAVAAVTAAASKPAPAPETWAGRPDWPPATPPPSRGGWLYGIGSLLLALALAAQVVTHQRDELATHPQWGGLVRNVYARLGMDVYPAWDLAAYEVRGSEAVAGRSTAGALDIVARLAVVGSKPVGLPLVRVTLRDRRGDVLGQRVAEPADYLPADAALAEPVQPGTLIPVEVSLADPGVDASGYEVDICLMTRAQGLVCQAEREPFQR